MASGRRVLFFFFFHSKQAVSANSIYTEWSPFVTLLNFKMSQGKDWSPSFVWTFI